MASPGHPPSVIRFGAFELDAACGTLRKGGVLVKMHPQPFRVLLLLSEYPGQIVTRDQIQRCLWGDNTFVDFEGGINFCVRQVRAALGDDADKPKYIETLPRRGYRFIASVGNYRPGERRIADKHSAPSGRVYEWLQDREVIGSSAPHVEVEGAKSRRTLNALRAWRRVAVTVLVVGVAAGAVSYALHPWALRARRPNFEGLRLTKLTNSGKAEDVAISPDGSYVVYSQRDRSGVGIWARHVESGSEVQILPSEEVDFRGLTFSRTVIPFISYVPARRLAHSRIFTQYPCLGGTRGYWPKTSIRPLAFRRMVVSLFIPRVSVLRMATRYESQMQTEVRIVYWPRSLGPPRTSRPVLPGPRMVERLSFL